MTTWHDAYSPDHPVRWEPAGEPESPRYLSVDDAVARLTRDGTDPVLAEEQLRSGLSLRTPFAFYQFSAAAE